MKMLKPRSSERPGSSYTIVLALPSKLRWSLAILTSTFEQTSSNRHPCPSKSLLVFACGKSTPLLLEGRGEKFTCLAVMQSKVESYFFSKLISSSKHYYAGESSPTLWQSLCPFYQNKSLVNQHKSDAFSNQQNYGDQSSAI